MTWFAIWTLAGAGVLCAHVFAAVSVWKAENRSTWHKLWAWLPPLTPWLAWRAGARRAAITWFAVIAIYILSRYIGR